MKLNSAKRHQYQMRLKTLSSHVLVKTLEIDIQFLNYWNILLLALLRIQRWQNFIDRLYNLSGYQVKTYEDLFEV